MNRRIGRLLSILLALTLFALLVGPAEAAEKISFRLNWLADAGVLSPYIAAKAKGFYAQEGLDVEFVAGTGSADSVKLLGANQNPLGQADAVSVIQGRVRDVPVKAVMAIDARNPFAILALKKSGITKLQDLPGHTAGVVPGGSPYAIYKALLKLHNIDASRIREVTVPAPGFAQLAAGQVEFINTFDNATPILMNMTQGGINVLKGADFGLDIYGIMVVGNEQFLREKPKVVQAFLRATKKGMDYTRENIEEIADMMVAAYPALKKPLQVELVKVWLPYWVKGDHAISAERMAKTQDLLFEQGLITQKGDVRTFFTNEWVPR
jgi:NitT/TauT family transport system substrate-binding protein